jgi:hypothetical protein
MATNIDNVVPYFFLFRLIMKRDFREPIGLRVSPNFVSAL